MVRATINGITVAVSEGTSILDAARKVQIRIPTLCKHPDLPATAACGICIVKIAGSNKMLRSCCTPLEQDMVVTTHDPEIVEVRRSVIELILSRHPNECLTCGRNQNCELQRLAADFGIRTEGFTSCVPDLPADRSTGAIVLEPRKCISCGRCIDVCQRMQNVWALSMLERGIDTRMSPAGDIQLADSPCVHCGQCSAHCPVGAIIEHDETTAVWENYATRTGTALSKSLRLFASPSAMHSGSNLANSSPANCTLRCAVWGSGRYSIPISAPM